MPFDPKLAVTMLQEVYQALRVVGLNPFLIQGQVLGAIRDEGFTPTEKDLDIGVLAEGMRLHDGDLLRGLANYGYEVETRNRTLPFRYAHTVVVYHPSGDCKADIVAFHLNEADGERYAITPSDVPKPYAIVHPRHLIEQYREVTLFGRRYLVPGTKPADTEHYLEREYGKDWRTPKDDHVSRARVYDYLKLKGIKG